VKALTTGPLPERRKAPAAARTFTVRSLSGSVRVTGPDKFNAVGESIRLNVTGPSSFTVRHPSDAWVVTMDVSTDGKRMDLTLYTNPVALITRDEGERKKGEMTFTLHEGKTKLEFKRSDMEWTLELIR
jgi:hypothetical protein